MLESLSIRDLAVVGRVDLDLGPGMTAVTGETGAGKSILVDALGLLAGGRADSGLVREGAERTEIAASFALQALPAVRAWLKEQELDEDGALQLRRVIRAEGSSRASINGRPVGLGQMRELAGLLIEIHGQHEHQALLSRSHQLALLDQYGQHGELLATVAQHARTWRALGQEIDALKRRAPVGADESERIRFELAELEALDLRAERIAELDALQRRLAHAGELLQGMARAGDCLDGEDGGALRGVLRARQELSRLARIDPGLAEVEQQIEGAQLQLAESAAWLRRRAESIEIDGEQLAQVETELNQLHTLARKHRVAPGELATVRDRLAASLTEGAGIEQRLVELRQRRDATLAQYREAADSLGRARREAAARLATEVAALMGELGMAGGVFECALDSSEGEPAPSGSEIAEFMVSANAGMPPRALRKVASGGELARISLAIKVATIALDDTPVLVFDEVDSGIGGAVAEIVGRKLQQLGSRRQVLCVTHLAQVAACAHQHLCVGKRVVDGRSESDVRQLDGKHRVEELARMQGGVQITAATRAAAADLARRLAACRA